MNLEMKKYLSGSHKRSFSLKAELMNADARTIEFSCASETPYERWFGFEILDLGMSSVRLGRMNDGAPLLDCHNPDEQIGVVEKCWIDDAKKQLRVIVRFSKGEDGEEVYQDVLDGIKRNVSIGYMVHNMTLENESNGVCSYRVIDWEPYEVSIVSIPADNSVGVGRASTALGNQTDGFGEVIITGMKAQCQHNDLGEGEVCLVCGEVCADGEVKSIKSTTTISDIKLKNERNHEMTDAEKLAAEAGDKVRVAEIEELGKRHQLPYEFAVKSGMSTEQYRGYALEHKGNNKPLYTPVSDVDVSKNEKRSYSVSKAIRAMITGNWGEAGYERECSDDIARRTHSSASGIFLPLDAFKRDIDVTAGAPLIATNTNAASFIDYLSNSALALKLGAKTLSGLVGNVKIPRKTGLGQATWGNASKSEMTLDYIELIAKKLMAWENYDKQLLAQSTPSIDALVTSDIITQLGLAVDKAVFHGDPDNGEPTGIINTSGINSVTGTTFTNATARSYKTKVKKANVIKDNLAFVMTPDIEGTLASTPKVSTYPDYIISPEGKMAGDLVYSTNQIADGHIFYGDFSEILVADWGVVDLTVDASTLAHQALVRVIAFMLTDIGVRHPGAFSASTTFSV